MKPKRRRLWLLFAALLCLGGATALTLTAFEESLAYFYSPSDLKTAPPPDGRAIRLGGLVAEGSVERLEGEQVRFAVTDLAESVTVAYEGALPDLFREGQGVVVEGRLDPGGLFRAETVLAKHDENYLPKEAVDALKAAGEWRPEGGEPGGQQ